MNGMKFWPCWPIVSLMLFMVTGCIWSAQSYPFVLPDEGSLERLRAGELILESGNIYDDGAAESILIFIQAPVERIWAIIISCEYASLFVDGLKFCEVLEERGDYALTHQVVDKGWVTPRMDFTFETERQPFQHMEFRMTQGNLKTMRGSWDFKSFPDGTLVRHVLVLRPALPAPGWLVRKALKNDLPDLVSCIRGLSGGGGTEQATLADLQKCPGEAQ